MSAPSFYRVIDPLDHLGALPAHIDGRQNGRLRLMARCPGHDDRSPSLSVEHKGDRTLVHCFAGCGTEHVLERLALEFADLYDERRSGRVPSASAPRGSGTVAPGTSGRRAENGRGFDSRKFKVLDVAKMVAEVPPEVPWQIDGLAVRGDVTIVTGDPGAGKSLLAPTLAGAVARGESIAGLNCERGSTVYLDAENGGREIHRRLHSLGMPDVDLAVVEADGVDLRHGDDLSGLDALVAQFGPSLLVLDSLTALWPGANERKTEDVAPTLYELKRLAERHGLAILVLHHRPKDGGEYRGTTAIAAAAQLGFTLSKAKDDPDRTRRRLHCWKCRPAPEPEDRWLHLEAERGMVLVGEAEPYASPDEPERRAPVKRELAPRFLEALGDDRLGLAEIASRLGMNPKDGTLRRVAQHLVAGNEIVRDDDKKYSRCQVPGAIGPKGAGTVALGTSRSTAQSGPEIVEGVGGARAGVEIGRPADWVEEAVDDFMRKAAESFPGAVEVSPGQSVWRPRPGSGTDPTLTQCADPAERQRLWGKHGVEWVRTPPPTPPVPTISEEELPAWLVSHGYGRLEESYVCRASKLDGEQCSNRRRPGSYSCGVHWPKGASR